MSRPLALRRITLYEIAQIKGVAHGELRWKAMHGLLEYVDIKENAEKNTYYVNERKLEKAEGITKADILRLRGIEVDLSI